VLFIENSGVRNAHFRDLSRVWSRLTNWWRSHGDVRPELEGIDVLSPLLLPMPYSRMATAINRRILLRAIRRWLARVRGDGPLIVITFLPTPLVLDTIHGLRPSLAVYYCIDNLSESSPEARKVVASEAKLFAEADLVMVTSRELYEMAKPLASHLESLVSGVRCDEFAAARENRSREHYRIDDIPRPRIGFVGSLRSAIDLDLLARVARLAPDLNFVLAGPHLTDTSALHDIPNIHLLGEIPHAEVIESMVRFDVGILPYMLNAFTAAVMPFKFKEYLAAGLPVVATPLPELVSFDELHPGVIAFARDAESFVRAIRGELARDHPALQEQRLTIARDYDWTVQIDRMIAAMERARSLQ
jgi:glycosyltransferase involved in cell wall biosynthesis